MTPRSVHVSVINPFLDVPFAVAGNGTMTSECRAFASLYREAVGTNSQAYEFLCLFKIAERITKRRARLAAEAVARGEKPTRPDERIPKDASEFRVWLNAVYVVRPEWDDLALRSIFVSEALGRKINDLRNRKSNARSRLSSVAAARRLR